MKNKVKFELQMIDVSYLVELVPKIPKEVKDHFAKEYGKLLDLIFVPIDADALRFMGAMAKYWNPILRIFEFPNVDASPTIEEYEVLLDIPLSNRLRVYLFTGTQDENEDIIKELIVEQGDLEMFKPALALAIYGKTLFPFVNDMVDQGAIDVLHKFRKFGVNPVPATCRALKHRIQDLIDSKWLEFKDTVPTITSNPLPNHGNQGINVLEQDDDMAVVEKVEDMKTPLKVIFKKIQDRIITRKFVPVLNIPAGTPSYTAPPRWAPRLYIEAGATRHPGPFPYKSDKAVPWKY
ncbi:hypothetical protein Lal_00008511 [Lupinus albus]|nr:hypothetical protein Lal_00008511 [Lupinus albus]